MLNDIWNLLKADRHSLNILNKNFANKAKLKFKGLGQLGIVCIFILAICILIGIYVNVLANEFAKTGDTFVALAYMILSTVIINLVNSVYKSQGMLFSSKDNDLLLSMPISKKTILATRIIKLLISQYIWVAIMIIPTFVVYAFYEKVTLSFILSSLVMLVCLPILPTIIGTIVGYVITLISSRFKNKNTTQIIISVIFFVVTFMLGYNLGGIPENMVDMNSEIAVFFKKIYYPLGLYIECLEEINLLKLLEIIAINIIPLVIFIIIFSYYYYNIISKLSENHAKSTYVLTRERIKVNNPFKTLIIKESKKYFRSSIYLLNTIIGPLMFFAMSIFLAYKGINIDDLRDIQEMTEETIIQIIQYMPLFVYVIAFFCVGLSNISASSISIEGEKLWNLKVLPIDTKHIFLAKILFHVIVILPPSLISMLLLCITLEISIINTILLLVAITLSVVLVATIGVVINILLPKLNANDIAVVKQSASSLCSILSTMLIGAGVVYFIYKMPFENPIMLLYTTCGMFIAIIFVLWVFLSREGVKKFEKL